MFEEGAKAATSPVERARHLYWESAALRESGEEQKGKALLPGIAADHGVITSYSIHYTKLYEVSFAFGEM